MVERRRRRTGSNKLKFCLDLSHHPWTRSWVLDSDEAMHHAADKTVRMIEAADQAGLDSVWVSEDPDGWDAFAVLSAATWTTKHIRLGPGVSNPYLRHPNLMAMSVSTLDRLSGGRAFLGLGRGQPEWYRESLGMDGEPPLLKLEATIRLLHQWWQPPYRAHSRSGVEVTDWARAIGPAQERPPIYIAALGEKGRDLAARMADGLLIADFASMAYLEELVPEMRERITRCGRDPEKFHFYLRTGISVTEDPGEALHYRKTLMALLAPLPGMSQQIVHPDYDVDEIVENLREEMQTREVLERGGNLIDVRMVADFEAARAAIPDGLIEDLSFAGQAEQISEKLHRLEDIGITHVFFSAPSEPDPKAFLTQLEQLGYER